MSISKAEKQVAKQIVLDELYMLLDEAGRQYLTKKEFIYAAKLLLRAEYKEDKTKLFKELQRMSILILTRKENFRLVNA